MSLVPDGWEVEKWMYYAQSMKFGFVDSFNEGKKGQSTGKLAGNISTQNKVLDMETGNYIQQHVQLLDFVEQKIYTLSGVTVTEGYSANGVDASLVYKEGDKEGFFLKGGVHSSTIDGKASITISGTTYAANAAASGTGFLFGGGYDFSDNTRIGYTYYTDIGGLSKADLGYIYYGYRF